MQSHVQVLKLYLTTKIHVDSTRLDLAHCTDSTRLDSKFLFTRLDLTRNFCWLDSTWLERDRKWLDLTRDSTSYWLDLTCDSTSYRLDSNIPWLDSTWLQHWYNHKHTHRMYTTSPGHAVIMIMAMQDRQNTT